jgi:hypothetical protein
MGVLGFSILVILFPFGISAQQNCDVHHQGFDFKTTCAVQAQSNIDSLGRSVLDLRTTIAKLVSTSEHQQLTHWQSVLDTIPANTLLVNQQDLRKRALESISSIWNGKAGILDRNNNLIKQLNSAGYSIRQTDPPGLGYEVSRQVQVFGVKLNMTVKEINLPQGDPSIIQLVDDRPYFTAVEGDSRSRAVQDSTDKLSMQEIYDEDGPYAHRDPKIVNDTSRRIAEATIAAMEDSSGGRPSCQGHLDWIYQQQLIRTTPQPALKIVPETPVIASIPRRPKSLLNLPVTNHPIGVWKSGVCGGYYPKQEWQTLIKGVREKLSSGSLSPEKYQDWEQQEMAGISAGRLKCNEILHFHMDHGTLKYDRIPVTPAMKYDLVQSVNAKLGWPTPPMLQFISAPGAQQPSSP